MHYHARYLIGSPDWCIVHYDYLRDFIDVDKVCKMRECSYVGEFALPTVNGGWATKPVQIYYHPEIYVDHNGEHSNYFGLFVDEQSRVRITDGIGAIQDKEGKPIVYSGVLDENSREVLYSAYRHDYQKHNDLIADGGRDYFRGSMHPQVQFIIVNGELHYVEKESNE